MTLACDHDATTVVARAAALRPVDTAAAPVVVLAALTPKNRGPDQWAPVIALATWLSEANRLLAEHEPVVSHQHRIGRAVPAPHQPAAGLDLHPRDRIRCAPAAACSARRRIALTIFGGTPPWTRCCRR